MNYKEIAYELIKKQIYNSAGLTDGEVISYIEGVIEGVEESERKPIYGYAESRLEKARNVAMRGEDDEKNNTED